MEQLELPSETYHALEHIAKLQGVTLLGTIERWIQQFQQVEQLHLLRNEYHELIDKDLADTLTNADSERLDIICTQINEIEMQSETSKYWQQKADNIDARFEELKRTISALPNRK